MLYDVTYWVKNGTRTKDFDSDMPAESVRSADPRELAHAVCTNGERHDFWSDHRGNVVPTPDWYKAR